METLALLALCALGLICLQRLFSGAVYDFVIIRMTERWYAAVISILPAQAKVLDVGIGTATALARNAAAVRTKNLSFVGVDYEAAYVARAQEVTRGAALGVALHCRSIYDEGLVRPRGRNSVAAAAAALAAAAAAGTPRHNCCRCCCCCCPR